MSGESGALLAWIRRVKETTFTVSGEVEVNNDTGNPLPVSGQIVPNRPSQGANRTYVTKQLTAQTSDAQLHTNTGGKTFYVTTIVFGMVNTSTGNQGQVVLRDGTSSGGTAILPFLAPTAGAGVLSSAVGNITTPVAFVEPVEFTSGVFCDITGGTITFSIMAVGYEE